MCMCDDCVVLHVQQAAALAKCLAEARGREEAMLKSQHMTRTGRSVAIATENLNQSSFTL